MDTSQEILYYTIVCLIWPVAKPEILLYVGLEHGALVCPLRGFYCFCMHI